MSYTLQIDPVLLKQLINQGFFNNNEGHQGTDLVKQAIHNNDLDTITYLIDHGSNPNVLCTACNRKNLEIISLLLNKGANPNIKERDTYPIISAVETFNLDIVKLLVEHGATVNNFYFVHSPLFLAVENNKINLIKFLLPYTSLPIRQEIFRWLIWNKKHCTRGLLTLFFEHDKESIIDLTDHSGNTMLHVFSEVASLGMVTFLLEQGADTHSVNNKGVTPKQIVEQNLNGRPLHKRQPLQDIITLFETYEIPTIKEPDIDCIEGL